ncbi:MAG: ribose 5-phosphate isomerase B [Oscillospiraceae bacterium]|nr:ribose 5-phosphate isomerase B [Oscillospiraceae bacterium]
MIAIASDLGGRELRLKLISFLDKTKAEYKDFGNFEDERYDYTYYAKLVAKAVAAGECDKGILICRTGVGMSITANKTKGIRCALCNESYTALRSRQHNDANILAIGSDIVGEELAVMITKTWLTTEFEGERHIKRIEGIEE